MRSVAAAALLASAAAGLSMEDIKAEEFHPDFPPKELLDVESKDWRGRGAAQNVAKIAEWFENSPAAPQAPEGTARERQLWSWGMAEYVQAFKAGTVTSAEYTRALVKRLLHFKALNTHCRTSYDLTDRMIAQAERVDATAAERGVDAVAPWYGLPVALKGTVATTDFPSSAGSGVLDSFYAVKDAEMTRLLKEGHAVIFGKTNTPEFAASYITMNHKNGVTRNPYHPTLSPGGSSGGSGSAVSARLAPIGVTEDTGGSTRHPASNNGNFGYDPPRNKYPNEGNPGMTYWNDQIGINTRSMEDILLFDAAFTGKTDAHANARKAAEAAPVRVAFPEEYFQRYTIPEKAVNFWGLSSCRAAEPIRNALAAMKAELQRKGHAVVDAEWKSVDHKLLGKVNSLYTIPHGHRVNGKHFEHFAAHLHSYVGQIQTYIEQNLGLSNITVGDVMNSVRPVGKSHDPAGFMGLGQVQDESQLRYAGVHAEHSRKVWNSFFDEHNLDAIVTPTFFTPALKLSEMAAGTGPLEVLQPDGSYKQEAVATAIKANIPIMLQFKHFPVPKVVVPLGLDSEGRPFSATIWGRSVASEAELYDDAAAAFDIPFLHKAARLSNDLSAAGIVKRVEPPTSAGIFADRGDEL